MDTRILDTTKKKDVRLFKSFPFKLYRGNPFWVLPFPSEIEFAMDRKRHPFYTHSDADFIVVESGKKILGRIAVFHNKNYCKFHKVTTAFFGYYEAVEDQEVANLLFAAVEKWCRERKIKEIQGPCGLLHPNCKGLLVEGFDRQPATGMTYNFPYYQDQFVACGFEKLSDHCSGTLNGHIDRKLHDISKKVQARGNFRVQNFKSKKEMELWLPRMEEVTTRALVDHPGFVPSTAAESELAAKNILALADPRNTRLILHKDEIAGFLIAIPNLNRGLRFAKSRNFPFGWLGLRLNKHFSRLVDLKVVGVLTEYRGLGGNAILYSVLDRVLHGSRYKSGELVQVDELNLPSKSDSEMLKVSWDKVYRTFRKGLRIVNREP